MTELAPAVIIEDEITDVGVHSLEGAWMHPNWNKYGEGRHLNKECRRCTLLPCCRGGCVGHEQAFRRGAPSPVMASLRREWLGRLS